MKKDLIFAPILFVISALLALLDVTKMPVHIALSVVGVAVLVAYTVMAKKDWKIPALEIAVRASYGIALITGIIIKISYVFALAIIHKIFAIIFPVLLLIIFVHKLILNNKK